jgi:hypothetical protein
MKDGNRRENSGKYTGTTCYPHRRQASEERRSGRPTIREASAILADLNDRGLIPEDVFYSNDVATRLAGFSLAGWANFPASSNEPLVFTVEGRRSVW